MAIRSPYIFPIKRGASWSYTNRVSQQVMPAADEDTIYLHSIYGGFLSHRRTPKSSILVGLLILNHPTIGVPPFQETSTFIIL